jgi:hypothetical protein
MPRLLGSGIASQSGDYLIGAGKETGADGEEFPKTQRAGIRTCVEGNVPLQSDPDADGRSEGRVGHAWAGDHSL